MLPGLSLAPLTLAAVLVLSGLAKLRDPGSTAGMVEALRLPRPLRHTAVPRALPVVELLTAALLLTPWAWTYAVGAAVSLGLFTAFLAVVARAMTFTPRPVCGCFGRVGDHRVNGRTVGRNVLLVVLALVAAWLAGVGGTAAGLVRGYETGDWVWLVTAAALGAVAVLVLGTGTATEAVRAPEEAARPAVGLHPGGHPGGGRRPAVPRGVLLSQDLEAVPLHRLARAQPQLLVLVNCWCGTTFESVERLPGWADRLPGVGVHLVHTYRPWEEVRPDGLDGVWWDPGASVYDALGAGRSPAAVLLGPDGLLAEGPVNGLDTIEELVDRLAARPAPARRD